jgi:ribosome-binding ATPase YchF (GTP1/OBG family)
MEKRILEIIEHFQNHDFEFVTDDEYDDLQYLFKYVEKTIEDLKRDADYNDEEKRELEEKIDELEDVIEDYEEEKTEFYFKPSNLNEDDLFTIFKENIKNIDRDKLLSII